MFRPKDWIIVKLNDDNCELYNLKDDPTKIVNLADKNTEKLNELITNYKAKQQELHDATQ